MPQLQRVYVVCSGARVPTPRGAFTYRADDHADLGEPRHAEGSEARHRIDAAARSLALEHPLAPAVFVLGPQATRLLIAELTGTSPDAVAAEMAEPGAVTVVGLPRSAEVIGPGVVGIVAMVLALLDNIAWGQWGYPFLATALVALASGLLLVDRRTRPWGVAGLKGCAAGMLLTVLLLASAKRFPEG